MIKYNFQKRLFCLVILNLLVLLVIFIKLFQLQIVGWKSWKETGDLQYRSKIVDKAKRGKILTNDGEVLAFDVEMYAVVLDPTMIQKENIDPLLDILSANIDNFNRVEIKKEIIRKKAQDNKYYIIAKKVNYNQKKRIVEEFQKNKSLNSGVYFENHSTRNYPKNNVFQEIVGFNNSLNKGLYGIEKRYDEDLAGIDGESIEFKSANGKFNYKLQDANTQKHQEDGKNIILTIDSVLQYALDDEIKKAYNQFSAESTMGIIMETETGKILAMSSYPKAKNNSELKNKTITDQFEPGSIFKPITVAVALQEGAISENEIINSTGTIKVADRVVRDHDNTTLGDLTLGKIIANSGNVAMVKIAQKMKTELFYSYLERLNLNKKTGIDIDYETSTKMFPLNRFTEVRKANVSFGQGISTTQIQIITALNAIVNHGKLVRPYIVDKIIDDKGELIRENRPVIESSLFSEEVSMSVRKLMEGVVTKGTGKAALIKGYRIGGKTGTGQKAGTKGYEVGKYFSSFFAFFPVDKPKYTILVTINEPKGQYYGAHVALPSVKAIIEQMIKYKGIVPEGEDKVKLQATTANKKVYKDLNKIKSDLELGYMPDFRGLSMREVLSVYPVNKYPNYEIQGSGSVITQSITPGSRISRNSKIIITME